MASVTDSLGANLKSTGTSMLNLPYKVDSIADVMKKAALAGTKAIRNMRCDLMLRHKGYKEIVTNCDIASENAITRVLKNAYPDSSIYSEEVGGISGTEQLLFIIDPIDGTHNFIHNIPFYAVSIGAYTSGRPFAGVIYLPFFESCYWAVKDKGAFLDDRPIRTSDISKLSDSMVAYDNQFHKHPAMLANLPALAEKCFTLRIFGSACVDICSVAEGKIEARIFHKTKIVDIAAGVTIVEQAGGSVVDFTGNPVTVDTTDVIVSNGRITAELVELLRLRKQNDKSLV